MRSVNVKISGLVHAKIHIDESASAACATRETSGSGRAGLGGARCRPAGGSPRPALALAQPGAADHAGETQAVEDVVALLALADLALVNRGRPLDDPVAVRDDADKQLGGLVLRLLKQDRPGHLGAHGPEPEGRVTDPLAGQRADGKRENPDAQPPHRVPALLAAEPARPGDEVGLPGQDRLEQPLDLGGGVLAGGGRRGEGLGAPLAGKPVAEPERGPLTPVDRHVADQRTGCLGILDGAVERAVRHHDLRGLQPAHGCWQRLDDGADRAFLVVGGDHDGHRRQLGRPGPVLIREGAGGSAVDGHVGGVGTGHFAASENSGQTVAMPDLRSCAGLYPSAFAAEMSMMTAGISPGLGGTFSAGISAPVTLRAVATISFTVTDSPAPRMSGPLNPDRMAVKMPATMSSTCTRSRTWVPSP